MMLGGDKQPQFEAVLAIKGQDFVMMAAVAATKPSDPDPKCVLHPFGNSSMLTFAGVDDACSQHFKMKILHKLSAFEVSNGYSLTPKAAMHFSRTNLTKYKRRQLKNNISIMIGAFDPINGPQLHVMDTTGMAAPVSYRVHGSHPTLNDQLLEMPDKPILNKESAFMALKQCADKIEKKFPGKKFHFEVFQIQKDGIKRCSIDGQQPLKRTFTRYLH